MKKVMIEEEKITVCCSAPHYEDTDVCCKCKEHSELVGEDD